jgi:hypothetical protein
MVARVFAISIALAAVIASAFAQDVHRTNCEGATGTDIVRVEPGPFRLVAVHCHFKMPMQMQLSGTGRPLAVVSPDTGSIAVRYVLNYSDHGMGVSPLSAAAVEAAHSHDVHPLAWPIGVEARGAFRWSADSQTLWSATQEHMRPRGGWAIGPVRPLRVENGMARELPELTHPAGPLDGLLWTDDGRALALFGARGNYYRPEVPNPNPTLAFVDAVNGRVMESLPLRSIHGADENATGVRGPRIRAAEVVGLPDGRLRAFLSVYTPFGVGRGNSSWVVWTQGEQIRLLPEAYPGEEIVTTMSRDGGRVLIGRNLHMGALCSEPGAASRPAHQWRASSPRCTT